ncbi:MAG: redox-sensing transcriptional repressor Rex [Deltaproteobacteria bacterium]|nr:redox-sensing transcriptional repressor Rex [Deltaproteobacteria bacterium]
MKPKRVPKATITRLSLYARCLEEFKQARVQVFSSDQLATMCQVNPAQIRKDLAYFGEFGIRGVGYYVDVLLFEICKILGLNRVWNLALIGMGNLGTALACYENFARRGYRVVAAFDNNLSKIGDDLPCGLRIEAADEMIEVCRAKGVEMAAVATPAGQAQVVVNRLVEVPVRAILNFAPIQVQTPEGFAVENVDFTVRLDRLAFHLTRG